MSYTIKVISLCLIWVFRTTKNGGFLKNIYLSMINYSFYFSCTYILFTYLWQKFFYKMKPSSSHHFYKEIRTLEGVLIRVFCSLVNRHIGQFPVGIIVKDVCCGYNWLTNIEYTLFWFIMYITKTYKTCMKTS